MSGGDQIIGDYKIEPGFLSDYCTVRKALGPWPLRNWSWSIFYSGGDKQCARYAEWATRIDAGDRNLLKHAEAWWASYVGLGNLTERQRHWLHEHVHHLPQQSNYDFEEALGLFQRVEGPEVETSAEVLIAVIAIPVLLICGFLYHSM